MNKYLKGALLIAVGFLALVGLLAIIFLALIITSDDEKDTAVIYHSEQPPIVTPSGNDEDLFEWQKIE